MQPMSQHGKKEATLRIRSLREMETTAMIWLLIALACAPQDIVVPYGKSPPSTIVWGPNNYTTSSNNDGNNSANDTGDSGKPSDTTEEGLAVGHMAPDLFANTSTGLQWSLHDQQEAVLLIAGNADGVALERMLEQAGSLPQNIRQVLLVGNNVYATPATPEDATKLQEKYPHLSTVLLDPTMENVNTWAERAPPKAYFINRDSFILWSAFQIMEVTQLSELMSSSP